MKTVVPSPEQFETTFMEGWSCAGRLTFRRQRYPARGGRRLGRAERNRSCCPSVTREIIVAAATRPIARVRRAAKLCAEGRLPRRARLKWQANAASTVPRQCQRHFRRFWSADEMSEAHADPHSAVCWAEDRWVSNACAFRTESSPLGPAWHRFPENYQKSNLC